MTPPLSRPRSIHLVGLTALGLLGLLATPSAAWAHSSAGAPGATSGLTSGLVHPISGIDHLLAMLAIGVVAALTSSRRTALLTPIGFLTGMVAGGVLGMGGFAPPGHEVLVAASVVGLGLLCAVDLRRGAIMLPLLAFLFGVSHGQAHGLELPGAASPVLYAVGVLLTSIALHLCGALGGRAIRGVPQLRVAIGTLVSGVGAVLLLGV
ncbi:MAG: HupE/UreJ family protein [Acidobacteria bacterium]|nr:HupE/UreJ family protein [Acidobacteriota bacterium]